MQNARIVHIGPGYITVNFLLEGQEGQERQRQFSTLWDLEHFIVTTIRIGLSAADNLEALPNAPLFNSAAVNFSIEEVQVILDGMVNKAKEQFAFHAKLIGTKEPKADEEPKADTSFRGARIELNTNDNTITLELVSPDGKRDRRRLNEDLAVLVGDKLLELILFACEDFIMQHPEEKIYTNGLG